MGKLRPAGQRPPDLEVTGATASGAAGFVRMDGAKADGQRRCRRKG
jgi:hypothetical protein